MAKLRIHSTEDKTLFDQCVQLDHQSQTQTVWQMQRQNDGDAIRTNFQPLRLPRTIEVTYPRTARDIKEDLYTLKGVLVAQTDDVLLGYAQVTFTSSDQGAWLRNWMVDAPARRHGIGTALLKQVMQWAKLRGANHLMVESTTRSYGGIQLLQSRGFLFCGFNDRYYPSQDIAIFFGQNL